MIETVSVTDHTPVSIWKKLNPLWWLVGPHGWTVPDINNGTPYLPDVKNIWLRRFYWFGCRNPLMNFVGYIIGVEDRNYKVTGTAPVLRTTGRDCEPPQFGWRWAVLRAFAWPWLVVWALCVYGYLFVSPLLFILPAAFCLVRGAGYLPFVSFYNGRVEFYLGWRPASGGFGFKLVFPKGAN